MGTSKNSATTNGQEAVQRTAMETEQAPMGIPSFILKFKFPIDLWLPLIVKSQFATSIISLGSTSDENKIMYRLSQTCKSFYLFYQPTLKTRREKKLLAAKELLNCFFMPTKENVARAMRILKADPQLAFFKVENEKMTDIFGRRFEGSLWQAAIQTGAISWLSWLKEAVIEKTNHQDLAKAQYNEKLGQADERKLRLLAQLETDLNIITAAFTRDPCTGGNPTLKETFDAFQLMREHFNTENQPGVMIKTGEFFPLEIMQKINAVYASHLQNWTYYQLTCYSTFVIGFAPRFFTAEDLLRLLGQGITQRDCPLAGYFNVLVRSNNQVFKLDFTQPDKYPDFRCGFNFFVDMVFGPSRNVRGFGLISGDGTFILNSLIDQKEKIFEAFRPEAEYIEHAYVRAKPF